MTPSYWSGIRFLTKAPYLKKLRSGEVESLSILTGAVGTARFRGIIEVTYKNNNETLNRLYYSNYVAPVKGMVRLLVKIPATETNFEYMEVYLHDDLSQSSGTEKRVYVPDWHDWKNCIRIAWLNSMGGIDHYTFHGEKAVEIEAERVNIEKYRETLLSTEESAGIMHASGKRNYTVFSDFENSETFAWLAELMTSPKVYVVESGLYIPIVIKSKNLPLYSADLVQWKLEYRYSNQMVVQSA